MSAGTRSAIDKSGGKIAPVLSVNWRISIKNPLFWTLMEHKWPQNTPQTTISLQNGLYPNNAHIEPKNLSLFPHVRRHGR